jgi:hypothetical protein
MDFHQLLAKMQQLDAPTEQGATEACRSPMGMLNKSPMDEKPDTPPPSMNVSMSAHGMNDIESMMKLFQKVNPDMMPKDPMPTPTMGGGDAIASISPSVQPLKMLPDFSDEPDNDEGPEIKGLDRDSDGDHDMDDHEAEPADDSDDEEKKKEAWANEPDETEKSIDYMNNKLAGGMNKPKDTFPKVADGDNPMQKVREHSDLRSAIRAELIKRLAEAKGAK